jgi:hypothetical protein
LVSALALFYSGTPTAGFLASAAIGILSIVLMPFVKRTDSSPSGVRTGHKVNVSE